MELDTVVMYRIMQYISNNYKNDDVLYTDFEKFKDKIDGDGQFFQSSGYNLSYHVDRFGNKFHEREFIVIDGYHQLPQVKKVLYKLLLKSNNINPDGNLYRYTFFFVNDNVKFKKEFIDFIDACYDFYYYIHSRNEHIAEHERRLTYTRIQKIRDHDAYISCYNKPISEEQELKDILKRVDKFFKNIYDPNEPLLKMYDIYKYINEIEFIYYDINEDKFYTVYDFDESAVSILVENRPFKITINDIFTADDIRELRLKHPNLNL